MVHQITDELCEALRCFQGDWDGLKATDGLDPDTASRLQAVHEEYE